MFRLVEPGSDGDISSLNGVGAAISITNGNVLDCEILSRYCKNCALHIPLKETNPAVYEGKCHLNHEGSTSKHGKCCSCCCNF